MNKKQIISISLGVVLLSAWGVYYSDSNKIENNSLLVDTETVTSPKYFQQTIIKEEDKLIQTGDTKFEFALTKGDTLSLHFVAEKEVTSLSIKNIDSGNTLWTIHKSTNSVDTTICIRFSAIYQLIINSAYKQYADINIIRTSDKKSTNKGSIKKDTVICEKADEGAVAFKGINFVPIYKEPQKNTVASQGKTLLGGRARVVIPVNLPKGTTTWAYQLRISTSKQDKSSDGTFVHEMGESYKKINIFGINALEIAKTNTSLIRDVLNSLTEPDKEEDAFCDFYIFTDKREAEKFSKGAENYNYCNEYSFQGTQSNYGEIPSEGKASFFIGLENTRFSTSVYTWIDAVAAIPTVQYYKINYQQD